MSDATEGIGALEKRTGGVEETETEESKQAE
jgi:hypothetical protein